MRENESSNENEVESENEYEKYYNANWPNSDSEASELEHLLIHPII